MKRQKEQKRLARATEKRDARLARRRAQAAEQAESVQPPVSEEPADAAARTEAEAPKSDDESPEIN